MSNDYLGVKAVRYFVQEGLSNEPITDDQAIKNAVRTINYKRIGAVNKGLEAIDCKKNYYDYQNMQDPELCQIFQSTEVLKKAVDSWKKDANESFWKEKAGKPEVFARAHAVYMLMLYELQFKWEIPQDLIMRKEGNHFVLETVNDPLLYQKQGTLFDHAFRIAEEMLVEPNAFNEVHTILVRLYHLKFASFRLYTSKEVDAGLEEAMEIRGCLSSPGKSFNLNKLMFKSVFLGNTRKVIVPIIKDDKIIQVDVIDDVEKLDIKATLGKLRTLTSDVISMLINFMEEKEEFEVRIRSSPCGIIAKGHKFFAIWNRDYPNSRRFFDRGTIPAVYISKHLSFPILNGNKCSFVKGLDLGTNMHHGPVFMYAAYEDDLSKAKRHPDYDTVMPVAIVQTNGKSYKNIESEVFTEFMLYLVPDLIFPSSLNKPVIWFPLTIKLPYSLEIKEKYFLRKGLPWCCSPWCSTKSNEIFIIADGLPSLQKCIDYFQGRQQPSCLKVFMIDSFEIQEDRIRDILRQQFSETLVFEAIVQPVSKKDGQWKARLIEEFGGEYKEKDNSFPIQAEGESACHTLHLAGIEPKINRKEADSYKHNILNFDVKLISAFVTEGFSDYRKNPNAIHITGSEAEIREVKAKLGEIRKSGKEICPEDKITSSTP